MAKSFRRRLKLGWFSPRGLHRPTRLKRRRRRGNEGDATSALDPGAGQKTPGARPECEQRRHYCRGPKPNHFCGTSQGKHTEDPIEKDCEASQTDLIRRLVELGLKAKK